MERDRANPSTGWRRARHPVATAPVLETERLLLRPPTEADEASATTLITREIARELKPSCSSERGGAALDYAIVDRVGGCFVGRLRIALCDSRPQTAILGFWVGDAYRNRGLMTEAARAALSTARQYLGIKIVRTKIFSDNLAAIRVLQRLGMKPCGVRHSSQTFGSGRPSTFSFEKDLAGLL